MYSNKSNSDKLVASILLAENSSLKAGDGSMGVRTCNNANNQNLSDSDRKLALEAERREASHHLTILSNSIFAAVGC